MNTSLRLCAFLLALFPLSGAALEAAPKVPAQAWLLVDYATGDVLATHNADRRLPPASLTKLMTTYLIFEQLKAGKIRLTDTVSISPDALKARGSRVPLKVDMQVSVEDLIKGMLVRSANNATVALAEHVAGSETAFVDQMNARARAWKLTGTSFLNSTGLDRPGHLSTANDLSRIAAALIRDFPDYYGWFSLRDFTFNERELRNSNGLLWHDDTVDGMKTGYTRNAGWCLVSSANREQTRLIATVLGAPSNRTRVLSSQRLLDYGFRNFETRLLYMANRPAAEARVWLGESAVVPVGLTENLYLTLPRGIYERLRTRVEVSNGLYAPVSYGQPLGRLTLQLGDSVYGEYPLVALKEIGSGGLVERSIDHLQLWLH
jgi:D-alanyl-D-alanine carboxypeptidase (penicillin-binding protein 5/6)